MRCFGGVKLSFGGLEIRPHGEGFVEGFVDSGCGRGRKGDVVGKFVVFVGRYADNTREIDFLFSKIVFESRDALLLRLLLDEAGTHVDLRN